MTMKESDYNDIFRKICAVPSKPWKKPVSVVMVGGGQYEARDGDGNVRAVFGRHFYAACKELAKKEGKAVTP